MAWARRNFDTAIVSEPDGTVHDQPAYPLTAFRELVRPCWASRRPHSGKHCAHSGPATLSSSTAAAGKRPGTSKRTGPDSHQADQPPANPHRTGAEQAACGTGGRP